MKCANCDQQLDIGVDVTTAQEGVVGTRGFVPLADTLWFCSAACLAEYFGEGGVTTLPRRIP